MLLLIIFKVSFKISDNKVNTVTMSETRIFRTETRPRREVSTSRKIKNEMRREIKQTDRVLVRLGLCLCLTVAWGSECQMTLR
jgi:hypothetical protein